PDGPYWLAGYSAGGMIAYAAAQVLRRANQKVARVLILDTFAPGALPQQFSTDWNDTQQLLALAQEIAGLERLAGPLFETAEQEMHFAALPLEEQLAVLVQRLQHLSPKPLALSKDHLRGLFRSSKATMQAMETYCPETRQLVPLTLLRTEPVPEREAADAGDAAMGWGAFAAGPVDLHYVPGDHQSMMREPHIRIVAECLAASLQVHDQSVL
ncbi:MAG: thioesterase domain-containing protein, partial [Chloroflexota bacterium]